MKKTNFKIFLALLLVALAVSLGGISAAFAAEGGAVEETFYIFIMNNVVYKDETPGLPYVPVPYYYDPPTGTKTKLSGSWLTQLTPFTVGVNKTTYAPREQIVVAAKDFYSFVYVYGAKRMYLQASLESVPVDDKAPVWDVGLPNSQSFSGAIAYPKWGIFEGGRSGAALFTAPEVPGTYYVNFRGMEADNTGHQAVSLYSIPITVAAPFDYSLSKPENIAIAAGETGSSAVTVNLTQGQAQEVNLSVSTVTRSADGVRVTDALAVTLAPASGNPRFTSIINVTSAATTPPGDYIVAIIGSPLSVFTHNARFTVTVTAPPPLPPPPQQPPPQQPPPPPLATQFDYSLSPPGGIIVTPGEGGRAAVRATLERGSASEIALAYTVEEPAGAAHPPIITPISSAVTPAEEGAEALFSFTTQADTTPGAYTVTVTGAGTHALGSPSIMSVSGPRAEEQFLEGACSPGGISGPSCAGRRSMGFACVVDVSWSRAPNAQFHFTEGLAGVGGDAAVSRAIGNFISLNTAYHEILPINHIGQSELPSPMRYSYDPAAGQLSAFLFASSGSSEDFRNLYGAFPIFNAALEELNEALANPERWPITAPRFSYSLSPTYVSVTGASLPSTCGTVAVREMPAETARAFQNAFGSADSAPVRETTFAITVAPTPTILPTSLPSPPTLVILPSPTTSSTPVIHTSTPLPDLVTFTPQASLNSGAPTGIPNTFYTGSSIALTDFVFNFGGALASDSSLVYEYKRTSAENYSPLDTPGVRLSTGPLPVNGGSDAISYAFGVNTPGVYDVRACADRPLPGTVTESDENNNCSSPLTITANLPAPPVSPPPPAAPSSIDSGLRVWNGRETVKIAAEPYAAGAAPRSPLRIAKDGKVFGIILVEDGDSLSSGVRAAVSGAAKYLGIYRP